MWALVSILYCIFSWPFFGELSQTPNIFTNLLSLSASFFLANDFYYHQFALLLLDREKHFLVFLLWGDIL